MRTRQLTPEKPANLANLANPSAGGKIPKPPYGITDTEDIRFFIDGFHLAQRAARNSPETLRYYDHFQAKFVWWLQYRDYSLRLLDQRPSIIREFLLYLQDTTKGRWGSANFQANKPMSAASVHGYARAVRALFRWSWAEMGRPLHENPCNPVRMPKVPRRRVDVYTEAEIKAMYATCDRLPYPELRVRNRCILAILLDSGIRAAEMLALTVADVDAATGMIDVLKGKGLKQRRVCLGIFARQELDLWLQYRTRLQPSHEWLFTGRYLAPLTYNGLKHMLRTLGVNAGISRLPVRPHLARHTAASMMYRNGMRGETLMTVLGHVQWDITKKYYLSDDALSIAAEHVAASPMDRMSGQLGVEIVAPGYRMPPAAPRSKLPDLATLHRECARASQRAVARKYGVSEAAVRKALRKASTTTDMESK